MRPFLEEDNPLQPLLSISDDEEPTITRWKRQARSFLNSRWGHYLILSLVTIDVCCSFAEFLIQLHVCEWQQTGGKKGREWSIVEEGLSITGLIISCLFLVELSISVLSFGMEYFSNWFHVFDSLVILVAFFIQVLLRGMEEEVGSLVIALRLWRVFQIIEELETANRDSLEQYEAEIEKLRRENEGLRRRQGSRSDENGTA
ncbi:hypothetical protein N7539_005294 [Penicillium diatomitis]|uniref:Voltage-gated hydrogen channel 1 n=1 Tax=Penicillium diatomitis TaxID=2819901 RepID=A0A9W9X715_9EURO|nr:uncharacterized protein N7539_005294 [Penicillium diatomitis]KAJ5485306.1 hypothetical protein N7539_005294 [Penicillium diatomitis]